MVDTPRPDRLAPPFLPYLYRLLITITAVAAVVSGVAAARVGSIPIAAMAAGFVAVSGYAFRQLRTGRVDPGRVTVLVFAVFIPVGFFLPTSLAYAVLVGLAAFGGTNTLLSPIAFRYEYFWFIAPALVIGYLEASRPVDGLDVMAAILVGMVVAGTSQVYASIADTAVSADRRYEELFATAANGMLVYGPSGWITLANREAARMLGYTIAELEGMPIVNLSPDDPELWSRLAEPGADPQSDPALPIELHRRDGRLVPVGIGVTRSVSRETLTFTAVLRDLSETAERLRQQDLVRRCIDAIDSAHDVQTALSSVLALVCEATGWVGGEVWIPAQAGSRLEPGVHHVAADVELAGEPPTERTLAMGEGLAGTAWELQRPVHTARLVESGEFDTSGQVLQFASPTGGLAVPAITGEEVVVVLVFHLSAESGSAAEMVDSISTVASQLAVTIKRKLAEEALRVSEARTRSMLRALPDLMIRLSSDGTYLDYQIPDSHDYFDSGEQLIGSNISVALPSPHGAALSEGLSKALETGDLQRWDYRFEIVDGSTRDREVRIVPIPELDEALVIVRDITERKSAERRLTEAIRSKDELIASVSHEIRTPLTAVVGFAELIQTGAVGEEERVEMMDAIAREASDIPTSSRTCSWRPAPRSMR